MDTNSQAAAYSRLGAVVHNRIIEASGTRFFCKKPVPKSSGNLAKLVTNRLPVAALFPDGIRMLKILTWFVACSLVYCITSMSQGSEDVASERNGAMFATKQNTAMNDGIPPIDLSAPVKTETATFALG